MNLALCTGKLTAPWNGSNYVLHEDGLNATSCALRRLLDFSFYK